MLEYAIKTSEVNLDEGIESIVADATLVANTSVHEAIGDTPASALFGKDLNLPGFEMVSQLSGQVTEQQRRMQQRDNRIRRTALWQLHNTRIICERSDRGVRVGDIISYELTNYDKTKTGHVSGERKHTSQWSLPYRVLEVSSGVVQGVPIWSPSSVIRQIPHTKIRVLGSYDTFFFQERLSSLVTGSLDGGVNIPVHNRRRRVVEQDLKQNKGATEEGKDCLSRFEVESRLSCDKKRRRQSNLSTALGGTDP